MAETARRPQLVAPRQVATLDAVRTATGGFDIDAFHAMDRRDDQLVADEILHGAGSSTFVYQFQIQGKEVANVSVVGARHLAAHYKGLQHRIVASIEKIGPLFTVVAYPGEHTQMSVNASVVPELADEADFYAVIVEMSDVKTGNRIQMERREARVEYRRDGSPYERPNYAMIAQSKAYRNAVLALVPQDVVIQWREAMLRLKKGETITASVLDEKRSNVLRFAAQRSIALDRRAVEALTLDQIAGLGDAAREGALPAFVHAAQALGLDVVQDGPAAAAPETAPEPAASPRTRERAARASPAAPAENAATAAQQAAADEPDSPASSLPGEAADRPREDHPVAPGNPPAGRRRRVDFEA